MIKIHKKKLTILIIVAMVFSSVLTVGGIIVTGNLTDRKIVSRSDYEHMMEISRKYGKLDLLQEEINKSFLWDTDEEKQMDAVYKALVESLGDKYSQYMNEEEYEQFLSYVSGTFTGIGITFAMEENEKLVIKKVAKDSPAEKAGLQVGDIIALVDGVEYKDADKAAEKIRGKEGTSLKLTYERNGAKKEVSVVRAVVSEPSVFAGNIEKDYGYIRITSFENDTAEQFRTELAEFERQGKKGIIIDLRNNPGGLLTSGIEIADMLLPECTITHTEDKNGKKEYYNSDEKVTKLHYVLLVNGETASASEILAGAVKDNKGGTIIGERTFGKGIIQNTMELTDHSALKLTTMQYFSPDNKEIHKVGVTPDIEVKLTEKDTEDRQLMKAVEVIRKETR